MSTNETLFLQAISSQMSAYAILAEHAREKVVCEDFEKRLITLANEFELAKHRTAAPLGITLR